MRYRRKFPSWGSWFGITRLRRVMPNRDPRDRNFCPYRTTLIVDTFSCIPCIYLFISCNKKHTVCRFCHYSSQVDRYVQFARAYCYNRCYWATAQKKVDDCIWRIKSTCVGILDFFCKNWETKSNILHQQTAQALIRLHRYLEMQSQLTMRAICSFFLDIAQQKHRWCHLSHDTKKGTCKNEVTPQAHLRSLIQFYIQGSYFYLSEQHGLWIECILTEELTMHKMIPTYFVLTLPTILGHMQVHVYQVTWSKSSYTPCVQDGNFLYLWKWRKTLSGMQEKAWQHWWKSRKTLSGMQEINFHFSASKYNNTGAKWEHS